jgi:hypothetical protein
VDAGVGRRVAVDLGRLELGREALRRLAPGRVLALDAVCGLEAAPFLVVPFLAGPFLAEPFRTVLALAVLALAVLALAVLALAALVAGLAAVLVRAAAPELAEVPVRDREVERLVLVRDREELADGRDDELRDVDRLPLVRLVPDLRAVDVRLAAGRAEAAGRAGASGLAVDMVLAADVSALAAVVMALVALFIACMAVDMVLAEVLALVAAWVILVAAEVTLVAAEETVRAALAGVADELPERRVVERVVVLRRAELPVPREAVVLRDAVLRDVVLRDVLPRLAELRVVRPDDDFAVAARADFLAPVAAGRAERREALVLADRVLPEFAGLREAAVRVVVCTGTEFPPS